MNKYMTQAEYARHRGIAPSAIRQAVLAKKITLIEIDGKKRVDPVAADAEWEANCQRRKVSSREPGARVLAPPAAEKSEQPAATMYDIASARAKREHHEANLAAMREAKQAGQLLEREAVARAAADVGAAFRQSAEQLVQMAKELAAETDPVQIRKMIEARVHSALQDTATRLGKLSAAGSQD